MLESELNLELPYISADQSGIGGTLRASPDHFVVDEVGLYEPQDDGQHLYVNITKVGLTTKEVQVQLEHLFGLPPNAVGFAGMKDKQAQTTQSFSLSVGHQPPAFAEEAAARIAEHLPVKVNWVRFHRNKLRIGHLLGNRFKIVVTEVGLPADEMLARGQAIADRLQQRGVPNYFGLQRLGRGGSNVRQGSEILRGERTSHDRWLRRFLVSAYQSYLCNRYLALRVEMGLFDRLMIGDVAKKYATGGMFVVEDVAAEEIRYAAHEISFTAPMFGAKMWEAGGEAGAFEATILAEANAGIDDFARAHVEGTRRLGRLLVADLRVAAEAGGLVVSFLLPKGAFATTIMREFMKSDAADQAVSEELDGE